MMDQDKILVCKDLCKTYNKRTAVLDHFNLELPAGRIVGLLGANGCGKTTLMKLICGLLTPDSGEILVCGKKRSEMSSAQISYLPERTYCNSSMRAIELFEYFSEFYQDFDGARARRMLSDLGIDPSAKLKTLSKGTKEKIQLVMVMARKAKLYLLDEPIAGVDPAARDYILQTIIRNYEPGATILITTHLIHDVEEVLDDFIFMDKGGRIVLSGEAQATREEQGQSLDELFREVFRCSVSS